MSSCERDRSSLTLSSLCLNNSESSSPFDRLSDDLLCIIFRLLGHLSPGILNHVMVCKRWCHLAYHTQTSISMRSSRAHAIHADTDLLKCLSKFTNLASLRLNSCYFDGECKFLLGLGFACPSLTLLDLRSERDADLTWDGLHAVFTACTGLQHLSIAFHASPTTLPPSFFGLSSLREVYLQADLRSLPDEFGKLGCLKKLTFDDLLFSELPVSFGLLAALTELHVIRCSELHHLPESFGGLCSLVKLVVSSASQLEELLDSIGRLQNLQECSLKDNSSLSRLPDSFDLLTSLRVLTIRRCSAFLSLSEIMERLSSLQHLELCQLRSLTMLPSSISRLPKLQTLSFNHCNSVSRVPLILLHYWKTSLTTLDFEWPTSSPAGEAGNETYFIDAFMWSVCRLKNLSTLRLIGLPRLTSFPDKAYKLKRLQRLTMCSCPDLRSLHSIYLHVTSLTTLEITACPAFEDEAHEISHMLSLESGCINGRPLGRGRTGGADG